MASRSKQKEEARARRLAEERAQADRAVRGRRLRMVGGVILAAIAVVAVLVAVSSGSGGHSTTGLQKGKAQLGTVAAVDSLLSGIPQSGARLGNPKAPVTMTYYGDLQCPICAQFTLSGGFPALVSHEIRAGKVQVVYRSFQTATRDPAVFKTQQVAALSAGQQQRFWNFAELFYREQGQEGTGYVTEAYLQGLAKQVSALNLSQWQSGRNNAGLSNQVLADEQMGATAGIQGTPTLVFSGPKGKVAAPGGVPSYANIQQAIKQVS